MLQRPSARRKPTHKQIELNLVPILDAMVTLIAFLLFTMSFISIVSIESPAPIVSAETNAENIKEHPLQLTVTVREKEVQIWSPFEKITTKVIPFLPDGQPDLRAIHEKLVDVKQKFPKEVKVVFAPYGGASYDVMVSIMDSMRLLENSDAPIYLKNEKTGNDEVVKLLFPDIVFGNILDEGGSK